MKYKVIYKVENIRKEETEVEHEDIMVVLDNARTHAKTMNAFKSNDNSKTNWSVLEIITIEDNINAGE